MLTILISEVPEKGNVSCKDSFCNPASRHNLIPFRIKRKIPIKEGVSIKSLNLRELALETALQEKREGKYSIRAVGKGLHGSVTLFKDFLSKTEIQEYSKNKSSN